MGPGQEGNRMKKRTKATPKQPDHVIHKDKDLRIPNATVDDVMRALTSGGAKPRPETRPTR